MDTFQSDGIIHTDGHSTRAAKKKALSIAVHYHGMQKRFPELRLELANSHKDIEKIRNILSNKFGYNIDDIKVLDDRENSKNPLPTRENIIGGIRELLKDTHEGDHVVFHFSGHGSQMDSDDPSEDDGKDELIWPCDVEVISDGENFVEASGNYIVDDLLKEELVDKLPNGVRLTAILDCCHSGTGLDLLHSHTTSRVDNGISSGGFDLHVRQTKHFRARGKLVPDTMDMPFSSEVSEGKHTVATHIRAHKPGPNDSSDMIACWSACLDNQLELEGKRTGGVFIDSLYHILDSTPTQPTNRDMLTLLTNKLAEVTERANLKIERAKKEHPTSEDGQTIEYVSYAPSKPVFSTMVEPTLLLDRPFIL